MQIIAEVGSNWKTLEDCIYSIEKAKECGADAVKFQLYTHQELYGVHGEIDGEMPREWIPQLAEAACKIGIEFMCTGFSSDGYRFLDPFVERHKVASSEITALDMLETLTGFGKPVIVSTGGATLEEIREAVAVLKDVPVTLMYCVAEYPARVIDFRHLQTLCNQFTECSVGYSDHSTDVVFIPSIAKLNGSKILEKHVNFTEHTDTPDAPHSLSFDEFKLMCDSFKRKSLLSLEETFRPNPRKRKMITLPDGTRGYFRPLPDDK